MGFLSLDGTFWVQLINFGIFFVILKFVFLDPVGRAIAQRRAYIDGVQHAYDQYRREARELRTEADQKRAAPPRTVSRRRAPRRTTRRRRSPPTSARGRRRSRTTRAQRSRARLRPHAPANPNWPSRSGRRCSIARSER